MNIPQRFLVPTDFSEAADYALDYALSLAAPLRARVDVLHVYPIPVVPDGLLLTTNVLDEIIRSAEDAIAGLMETRRNSSALGEFLLKDGDARDQILETVVERGIDFIVMGTHGKRGIRTLFGSVTEAVLRTASCPVLAVKPPSVRLESTEANPDPSRSRPEAHL